MLSCYEVRAGAGGGGSGVAVDEKGEVSGLDPSRDAALTRGVDATSLEATIRRLFLVNVRKCVRPYYERITLIKEGKLLEAISMKPSQIWYATTYLRALQALGDTRIPVGSTMPPAHVLLNSLRDRFLFAAPLGHKNYWENIPDELSPTGLDDIALRLKRGVSASAAFGSFFETLSFTECYMVPHRIALNLMLIDLLTPEKYDNLASTFSSRNLEYFFESDSTSCKLMETIEIPERASLADPDPEFKIGQIYYMRNHFQYRARHPHGDGIGINIVYIGKNSEGVSIFTGLGLNPEGETLNEIAHFLLREFNEEPLTDNDVYPEALVKEIKAKGGFAKIMGKDNKLHSFSVKSLPDYIRGEKIHALIDAKAFKKEYQRIRLFNALAKNFAGEVLGEEEFFEDQDFFGSSENGDKVVIIDLNIEEIGRLFWKYCGSSTCLGSG